MRSIIFLFILSSLQVFAQEYKSIKDPNDCKDKLEKKHQNLNSVQADFTESTHTALLSTPQKASGKMYYKKTNKIRWEKSKPTSQIILMNGKNIRIQENGKEVSDATTKATMKRIQTMMVNMMTGSFLNEVEFSIKYSESSVNYKLNLTPKNDKLKRYIQEIVLVFRKSDCDLKELTLVSSSTNKIVYTFSNMVHNESILETLFTKF
jgi:outer membrane lipoprotein carrier protein